MSSYAAFRGVSAYAGYVISINGREPYAQPWNAPLIETTKTDSTSVTDVDMRTLPTLNGASGVAKDYAELALPGRFFSIHPSESMGYCGRYVCPLDSRPKDRKAFSYNKRTMDRAMGPF
jgi:hypothetical protein